jgi:hypothetical protein
MTGLIRLAVLLTVLGNDARAAERGVPLSAPVKVLSAASAQSASAMQRPTMTAQTQRPQPTTPGGKLPQYRLDARPLVLPAAGELDDPRLRLILALPAKPVLLEATVTIDGQPFHRARERRVQQMIEQMASDEAAKDDVAQRMGRYLQATEGTPSPEEVRWLLTHWVDGPTLLLLNDNFQRFRANQRPVFHVLDRDRDGTVSAAELERAVESFKECDLNRNDIVEYTELAEVAHDPRRKTAQLASPGTRLFQLPDDSIAAATYRRLALHYAQHGSTVSRWDSNADGRFDADELAAMRTAKPDISLTVAFNSADPSQSQFACSAAVGRIDGTTITLPLGGALVAFSAVQDGPGDQISLGAIDDGYPLLPLVDPNEDGRFTLRELRSLVERLKQVDANQDGRLTEEESQPTIRVCFGLGPNVHRELAGIRQVRPQGEKPPVTGPEWFVRMDRNKDQDLTRGEFPGTDEQFAQLDADSDELISAEEAISFDKKPGVPENDSASQELQAEKQ